MVPSEDVWVPFTELASLVVWNRSTVALHRGENDRWRNVQLASIDQFGYTALDVRDVVKVDNTGKACVLVLPVIPIQ